MVKKKAAAVAVTALLIFCAVGCGGKNNNSENSSAAQTGGTDASQNTSQSTDGSASENDITKITQDEVAGLAENEFYVSNATSGAINKIYVAVTGSGDWGNNLLSSPLEKGTKIKLSLGELQEGVSYDICTVDAENNTVEYYTFDMKATVQVTFYDNAECDVTTI